MEPARPLIADQSVKPKNKLALFAILLSVVAILTALILYRELKNDLQTTQNTQIKLASTTVDLSHAINDFQVQFQTQENKLNSLSDTLQYLSQRVSPVESGVLIQAEYLAQLAQLNLKYQGDVAGALSLLKMADQRLNTLSLSPILEVRQIL